MSEPITIDIWSDVACPWCYIGKHRFEQALATFGEQAGSPPVAVTWHSYQLAPDLPEKVSTSHAEYLGAKLGWSAEQVAAADRRITDLGRPLGLAFDFEANRVANTGRAHELLHFAREHGRQDAVKEALFKAFFEDGIDISDPDVLASVAEKAGLARDEAAQALASGRYGDAVRADRDEAARLGINGVPFFVLDSRYGLSGAQEPDTFLDALRQLAAKRQASSPE